MRKLIIFFGREKIYYLKQANEANNRLSRRIKHTHLLYICIFYIYIYMISIIVILNIVSYSKILCILYYSITYHMIFEII